MGAISGESKRETPHNCFLRITRSGSIDIAYRRPYKGQPCLMPLVTEKDLVKDPLILSIL